MPGHFTPELFAFLAELRENNRREWFQANRARYERAVRDPFLRFITDLGAPLARVSPHFLADPRPSGGSMFRIYRDTRFSRDKSPYKTHAGAHFRHRAGESAHAPGFYLHLQPGDCFVGAGIWAPEPPVLRLVRDAVATRQEAWRAVREAVDLGGDAAARVPRGYDPAHRFADDLRRVDFVTGARLTDDEVCAPDFLVRFTAECGKAGPLVRFVCDALELPF